MRRTPNSPTPARGERGFSLIELVVASLIAVEILVAAGIMFDLHNRLARVQAQITDTQQSLRVGQYDMVRTLRMAGRGGLPARFLDTSVAPNAWRNVAVDVRNNVDDTNRAISLDGTLVDVPLAVAGSDILTVRGCITTTLYQTTQQSLDGGSLTISNPSPVGLRQSLTPIKNEIDAADLGSPDSQPMLAVVSPVSRSIYATVRVTDVDSSGVDADGNGTMKVDLDRAANTLGNAVPAGMTVGLVCLVEEYRYYIREDHEIPGDATTPIKTHLSRARMQPGTDKPYGAVADNLRLDIADDVIDLQVALGYDTDYPSTGTAIVGAFDDDLDNMGDDDVIFEDTTDAGRATDDWLYNSTSDDPTRIQWTTHRYVNVGTGFANTGPVRLYHVRVSTVARTARPDPRYEVQRIGVPEGGNEYLEDNDYSVAPSNFWKTADPPSTPAAKFTDRRMHRIRLLRTEVQLRNVS
ncbi:MAG: hypothetical protein U0X73_13325 [Thermoanaerobaculia bacterium]